MRSLRVPDDVWEKTKELAAERGISLGQLVIEALQGLAEGQDHDQRFGSIVSRLGTLTDLVVYGRIKTLIAEIRIREGVAKGPLQANYFNGKDFTMLESMLDEGGK